MSVIGFHKAVIQCAVPPEFEALRQLFRADSVVRAEVKGAPEFEYFEDRASGVVCVRSGMGGDAASAATTKAWTLWHPRFYIDFGVCGALAPGLLLGDIILAEDVLDVNGVRLSVKGVLWEDVPRFPEFKYIGTHRFTRGLMTEQKLDVVFDDQRRFLYSSTKAIGVNWESYAIAKACSAHSAEFHSFRLVSEAKEEDAKKMRLPETRRKIFDAAKALKERLAV